MAKINNERQCFCCQAKYTYCGRGCKGDNPDETWRYLFDSERCRVVYEIWQQYRAKQIGKEEAKRVLKRMDIDDILNSSSIVVPILKEILDIVEGVKEPEAEFHAESEAEKEVEEPTNNDNDKIKTIKVSEGGRKAHKKIKEAE